MPLGTQSSERREPFLRRIFLRASSIDLYDFLTAQMSVFMVFRGPHLPLAFQFVCGPGGGGAANKLEGKRKVSLCLVAPPLAAAEYSANSSFCWRTTFEDICAVRKWSRRPHGVFGREGNVIFAFKMVETEQPPPFSKRRRRQLTNGMFSRRLQPFSNRRRRRRMTFFKCNCGDVEN